MAPQPLQRTPAPHMSVNNSGYQEKPVLTTPDWMDPMPLPMGGWTAATQEFLLPPGTWMVPEGLCHTWTQWLHSTLLELASHLLAPV